MSVECLTIVLVLLVKVYRIEVCHVDELADTCDGIFS